MLDYSDILRSVTKPSLGTDIELEELEKGNHTSLVTGTTLTDLPPEVIQNSILLLLNQTDLSQIRLASVYLYENTNSIASNCSIDSMEHDIAQLEEICQYIRTERLQRIAKIESKKNTIMLIGCGTTAILFIMGIAGTIACVIMHSENYQTAKPILLEECQFSEEWIDREYNLNTVEQDCVAAVKMFNATMTQCLTTCIELYNRAASLNDLGITMFLSSPAPCILLYVLGKLLKFDLYDCRVNANYAISRDMLPKEHQLQIVQSLKKYGITLKFDAELQNEQLIEHIQATMYRIELAINRKKIQQVTQTVSHTAPTSQSNSSGRDKGKAVNLSQENATAPTDRFFQPASVTSNHGVTISTTFINSSN